MSTEKREEQLGRFLCFLNTLSATHSKIRAVLAEERWFSSLVKIVNIDTATGQWTDTLFGWGYNVLSMPNTC